MTVAHKGSAHQTPYTQSEESEALFDPRQGTLGTCNSFLGFQREEASIANACKHFGPRKVRQEIKKDSPSPARLSAPESVAQDRSNVDPLVVVQIAEGSQATCYGRAFYQSRPARISSCFRTAIGRSPFLNPHQLCRGSGSCWTPFVN